MADKDKRLEYKAIPVTGRWRPAVDGTQMNEGDFQTLTNMRYTDTGIKSIKGMTAINSSVIDSTYLVPRAGFHFKKDQPAESHILVQSWNAGLTAAQIHDNATAVPGTGDFTATALMTDTSGSEVGRFSMAPDGAVAYCNEKDTMIWTGAEGRLASFFIGDSSAVLQYDYSKAVNNTLTDASNVATMALNTGVCYAYLGCLRPIKGAKFYIGTANTATATLAAKYWGGGSWLDVSSQVDGTSVGGKTLVQTGSVTFTSTTALSRRRYLNGQFLFWYQFIFTGSDATTTVYYITVDAPIQTIADIWDGTPRTIGACKKVTGAGTAFQDVSVNVLTDEQPYQYDSSDATTFMDLSALDNTNYFLVGFAERMIGIKITMGGTAGNANTADLTASYWTGKAFSTLTQVSDGTKAGGKTLCRTGVVTWTDVGDSTEFKYTVGDEDPLFYYKIAWSATLSATVHVDKITGIPCPTNIRGYKFPVIWKNRLGLACEKSYRKNMVMLSSTDTNCVFNGDNSDELYVGDDTELMAGGALFSRFGSDLFENLLLLKRDAIYIVDGSIPDDFKPFQIGEGNGCVAPQTFVICNLGYEIAPGINKQIAIWQSSTGVMIFDGASLIDVSSDISNYFNQNLSGCISSTYIHRSVGFYDESKREYHLLITTSGTSHNVELVFDLMRKKWFKIDRGAGKYLQVGFSTMDTTGNKYVYGLLGTGYMHRLEYGNTFDSTAITATHRSADYPLSGWMYETNIRRIKHLAVASTTSGTVTLTHYGDCITTSGDATVSDTLTSSTHRILQNIKGVNWRSNVFHSIQGSSTSSTGVTYEPIGLGLFYQTIREDVR